MARAAGFAFGHVIHGGLADNGPIREKFGMALFASEGLGVEGVAERGRSNPSQFETDFNGFHSFVAPVTVAGNGKGGLAIMAGSTACAFLHLGHGHGLALAGNDFAVVAAFTGSLGCCKMVGMAEDRFACSLNLVRYIAYFAPMTENAIFFRGNAEGFHATVASAAGFGFLHLGHSVMAALLEIENRIVAYFTVVVVLTEVGCVAEDDRSCIPEAETDVFQIRRNGMGYH